MTSFQATLSPAWTSFLSLRFIYTVASLASPLESLMAIKTLHDQNGTSDSPPPAPKPVLCSIFLLHSGSSNTKPWSPSCPLSFSCKQHPIYHPIPVALPRNRSRKWLFHVIPTSIPWSKPPSSLIWIRQHLPSVLLASN